MYAIPSAYYILLDLSYSHLVNINYVPPNYEIFYSLLFFPDIFINQLSRSYLLLTTRYGMSGPGIESRWERDFEDPSRRALGPTQSAIQCILGHSLG